MGDSHTIEDAARAVLAEVSPGELDYLQVSAKVVLSGGAGARRARLAALGSARADSPTGFGADQAGAVVAFLLTVLSGAASNVLSGELTDGAGWLRQKWRAWRQRRAIAKAPARDGLDTPLPALTALQAARIGKQVLELAVSADVPAEQAQRIATLIAAALTAP